MKVRLSSLKVHPDNARKIAVDDGIVELAASIKKEGLLQPLVCVEHWPDQGEKEYLVCAGQRRLLALQQLDANGNPVNDVEIVITDKDPILVSLAENLVRTPMRPVDQFKAFEACRKRGIPIGDIAESFSVSPIVVNRRMELGKLCPEALKKLDDGDIPLEYAMALTLCKNAKHQKEMMRQFPQAWQHRDIKRTLTESRFPASSAAFDLALYKGNRITNLFASTADNPNHVEDYLTDFDQALKLQILEGELRAAELRDEGWKWVEFTPTQKNEAKLGYEQVFSTSDYVRKGDCYRQVERKLTKAEMAQSGVLICLDTDWSLSTMVGMMTPEEARTYRKEKKAEDAATSPEQATKELPGNSYTYSQLLQQDLKVLCLSAVASRIAEDSDEAVSILLADWYYGLGAKAIVIQKTDRNAVPKIFDYPPPDQFGKNGWDWIRGQLSDINSYSEQRAADLAEKLSGNIGHNAEGGWIQVYNAIRSLSGKDRMALLALSIAKSFDGGYGDQHEVLFDKFAVDLRSCWKPDYAFWSRFNKPQMAYILVEELKAPESMVSSWTKNKTDDLRVLMSTLFSDPEAKAKSYEASFKKKTDLARFVEKVNQWVPFAWEGTVSKKG